MLGRLNSLTFKCPPRYFSIRLCRIRDRTRVTYSLVSLLVHPDNQDLFYKEVEVLCAICKLLNLRSFRISRLPKALFRELVGNSYPWDSRHQILMHLLLLGGLSSVQSRLLAGEARAGRHPQVRLLPTVLNTLGVIKLTLSSVSGPRGLDRWRSILRRCSSARFPITNSERNEPSMKLPRELRIISTDDSRPRVVVSRGFREGRQGSREKPDRTVWWNAQRCYRTHPYWTESLKYVR